MREPYPSVPYWQSKKFASAVIATALSGLALYGAGQDATPAQRVELWETFIQSIAAVWGIVIAAQGAADYAERRDVPNNPTANATPPVQVLTGEQATGVSQQPGDASKG